MDSSNFNIQHSTCLKTAITTSQDLYQRHHTFRLFSILNGTCRNKSKYLISMIYSQSSQTKYTPETIYMLIQFQNDSFPSHSTHLHPPSWIFSYLCHTCAIRKRGLHATKEPKSTVTCTCATKGILKLIGDTHIGITIVLCNLTKLIWQQDARNENEYVFMLKDQDHTLMQFKTNPLPVQLLQSVDKAMDLLPV
jgi:hypothetical protein